MIPRARTGGRFDLGIRCDHFISMAGGKARPERDIFVGIRDGRIAEILPWKKAAQARKKAACRKFVEARNQVVLPGLVNGHTHLAMSLFRGLEDDLPLQQWLFDRILPLEAQLVDRDFVRTGTELALLECIRFGVTTVCDMYFFAETTAECLDRAGIRGLVAQVFAAHPLPEDKKVGMDKTRLFEGLVKRWGGSRRITPVLGPHALYTTNEEILSEVARLSTRYAAPVHIHLSETRREVEEWKVQKGKSPVRSLKELGVLNERTICAHCVHLDDEDIALMKDARATVVHNPDSNLKLGSGIAPLARYLAEGIRIALGTDGAASNNDLSLFGAMDLATKLQKGISGNTTAMVAEQALWCATGGGAEALGLGSEVGTLEVGKRADLIAVDLDYPHLQPLHNIVSHLVYSAQGLEVNSVICEGRFVMKNRKILTLDQPRILKAAEKIRARISRLVRKMGHAAQY